MPTLDRFSKSYLTVPVFVKRAYKELEALDGDGFRLRRGEGTKELVEEILPLTTFLKHFERPRRTITCRFVPGNQNFDAIIKLKGEEIRKGFLKDSYFLEVTTAVSSNDYLSREALSRYGSVFGGSYIRRIGSRRKGNDQIESRPVAQDHDAPVLDAIEWTKQVIRKKASMRYPQPCILVIQVEIDRPFSIHEWSIFAMEIQSEISREVFQASYIVNWQTNSIFEV